LSEINKVMKELGEYIVHVSNILSGEQVERMIDILINAKKTGRKILILGAGRSGLVGRAFAMRLMHLGFTVYVVGETITPPIREGDVIIAISGSGRTHLVVVAAEVAKKLGAKVIAVTSYPDSPLGRMADHVVYIPGRTKVSKESDFIARQIMGLHEPLAPLGTLFENTAMAFLDSLIVLLMKRMGISEKELEDRHANIEMP